MALTLLDCQIRICSIADRYLLVADLIDPPRRKRGARPRSRGDPWGGGHVGVDRDAKPWGRGGTRPPPPVAGTFLDRGVGMDGVGWGRVPTAVSMGAS